MNIEVNDKDKITMTQTGLLESRNGKVVHVCFERQANGKTDYAEIVLPSRSVVNSRGFEDGELAQLRLYLKDQEKNILRSAKQINHDLIYNF